MTTIDTYTDCHHTSGNYCAVRLFGPKKDLRLAQAIKHPTVAFNKKQIVSPEVPWDRRLEYVFESTSIVFITDNIYYVADIKMKEEKVS